MAERRAADNSRQAPTPDTATADSPRASSSSAAGAVPVAPTLSLPKGGGAIRGIDEKFSTNLVTGTASFSVPIATSHGRSGVAPELGLSYDSGTGNGPFGIGWHQSVPAITRKTDKGLPQYIDAAESDVYVLAGAEDLEPIHTPESPPRDGYRIQRYRPRVEGLFARIERWTDETTADIHFRVTTRDNVTSIYGRSAGARIADPAAPARIFSWLLEETRDDRGNVMRYSYKAEDSAGVDPAKTSEVRRFAQTPGTPPRFLATAQRYLKHIQYGNRVPLGDNEPAPADPSAWLFEVVFDYGEHDPVAPTPDDDQGRPWLLRLDPHSSFRAGFEVRTYRLCRRVLVFHRFAELGDTPCLVRSTDFTYDESPTLTYLTKVEQVGYRRTQDGASYSRAALPPLALDYARLTTLDDTVQTLDRESLDGLPEGVGGATQWLDLDGEGIPGVLRAGDRGWYYKANLGEGRLAPPTLLGSLPVPADLSGGFQQFADVQGDGRLELVRYAQPLTGYFTRTTDGSWEPFIALRAVPNIDWNDANLRTIDLDGDGHPDVLITEHDAFVWYRSLAQDGFEPARRVTRALDEEKGPAVVFADGLESIYLADMSGDGLADIVRVRNGDVCYWPNLGHGRFGSKVTMDRSPVFDRSDRFDPKRVRFADVDGSGLSDILYLGRDGVAIYLNQAGNGFSEPQVIRSLPLVDTLAGTTVVDLRGRGTSCLVWSSPAPASASHPLAYIDLMGGAKPHLLVSIKNNLGAETRISYASSTQFYLADKAAGTPWITRLAFPVHVVERVTTYDRISRNRFVTRYSYHHGYFDGIEREFRGFGRVDQLDTEELAALTASGDFPAGDNIDAASYVPPVLTKTWFHTGAFFDSGRISTQFEREYHAEPGLADEQRRAMLLDDTVLPAGLAASDAREACRALKGSILRREIFALDGTEAEARPYLASERNYTIVPVQPRGEGKYGIFFAHPREAIEFHYERKLYDVAGKQLADPRVTHALTLDVDDFGNVLRSVSVGYGRRHDSPDPVLTAEDRARQSALQITSTKNAYTAAVDEESAYRAPLPSESRHYEITKLSPSSSLPELTNLFGFDELVQALDGLEDGSHDLPYEDLDGAGATQPHPYRRLIEQMRTLYRRDDLTGPLALGHAESRALPFEGYKLALTPGLVTAVYGDRVTDAILADEGGYVHSEGDANWWIPSGRVFYSPGKDDTAAQELAHARQHFFLPCGFQDPFGQTTTVTYDPYDLLVLQTRDPLDNLVTVGAHNAAGAIVDNGNDYRLLQPARMMDPNRNRKAVAFDALGMVVGTAVMGNPEEDLGDSLDGFEPDVSDSAIAAHLADPLADPHSLLQHATTRLVYDLFAYQRTPADPRPQSPVVYTLARETHEADLLPGQKTKILHSLSYSDGFGREIQKKVQAEPGPLDSGGPSVNPRWVGSGWTIFNNKGKPVRRYEPFFTSTHRFESSKIHGVSSVLFYDPSERVVATLHPEHTYEKVVFDPWQQANWDVNDTILQADPKADPDVGDFFVRLAAEEYLPTWHERRNSGALGANERDAANKAAGHAGTPAMAHFDALGRTFLNVAHNRFRKAEIIIEERYRTTVTLDIEGNHVEVHDANGVGVLKQTFDLSSNVLRAEASDAGTTANLVDVLNHSLRARDARGVAHRKRYDEARRLTHVYVAPPGAAEFVAERLIYGEGLAQPNLRGRLYQHFDSAGVFTTEAVDFEGRVTRTTRRLAVTYRDTPAWNVLEPAAAPETYLTTATNAGLLESDVFVTRTDFDAMSRVQRVVTPDATAALFGYNEASLLDRVDVQLRGAATATPFVSNIDYNSRGQRTELVYGRGVTTTYTYDEVTTMLVRIVTTRPGDGQAIQDLHYTLDPVHNIVKIEDSAQQRIYFSGDATDGTQTFEYDAVYRLTSAEGREHPGQVGYAAGPNGYPDAPPTSLPHPNDLQALLRYIESYTYDAVGNLQAVSHCVPVRSALSWTRRYVYAPGTNHLQTTSQPGDPNDGPYTATYDYDARGNCVRMPHLSGLTWDHDDRLASIDRGGGGRVYYVYDSKGERTRKVIESGGTIRERVYIGNFERYRERTGSTITLARETVHLFDGHKRLALVETETTNPDSPGLPRTRIQLANHLGTAAIEVDPDGTPISYEEFYPFGGSSFRSGEPAKRYRYTGKEHDEESGFYYHGARYLAPWLGRWISPDPAGLVDGTNVYAYVENNPLKFSDPTGMWEWPSGRTIAVVAAVVVVGTVVTVFTAGAAAPVVAAAVASIGLTGTAATVATGVAVGAIAGAAGGIAGEVARTGVGEGRLPTGREIGHAALAGAVGGAVTGGLSSAATAIRASATAARSASAAATTARSASTLARVARGAQTVATRAAASAGSAAAADTAVQLVTTGHVDAAQVARAAGYGAIASVALQTRALRGPLGAIERAGARLGGGAVRVATAGAVRVSPRFYPAAGRATAAANRALARMGVPTGINRQQQAGHIEGTPQHTNRLKVPGKLTSTFSGTEAEAEQLTNRAWSRGRELSPNTRVHEFDSPVGTGPTGGGYQTQVRVTMNEQGQIHGSPWGPVYQGPLPRR